MNQEKEEFIQFVQQQIYPAMTAITKHPYFIALHTDMQTDFLSTVHEAFERDLGIDVDLFCENFNEIFDAWEAQDKLSQMLKRATM